MSKGDIAGTHLYVICYTMLCIIICIITKIYIIHITYILYICCVCKLTKSTLLIMDSNPVRHSYIECNCKNITIFLKAFFHSILIWHRCMFI